MAEEEKEKTFEQFWENVLAVRTNIQTRVKERYDRIKELQTREKQKKKELEELERLKNECSSLLVDPRYTKFQKLINSLYNRLNSELKDLGSSKCVDEVAIKMVGVSRCLELLDTFIQNDKRMKEFLDKVKK